MSAKSIRSSSLVFLLLLCLSGLSFGFLVGRSQQHQTALEQRNEASASTQVLPSAVLVGRLVKGTRNLLIK